MRPPMCDICDKRFDPFSDSEGGLVTFKVGEEDKEQLARLAQPGFVGHPPNQDWYCADHIQMANALSHLTIREARAEMRRLLAGG